MKPKKKPQIPLSYKLKLTYQEMLRKDRESGELTPLLEKDILRQKVGHLLTYPTLGEHLRTIEEIEKTFPITGYISIPRPFGMRNTKDPSILDTRSGARLYLVLN